MMKKSLLMLFTISFFFLGCGGNTGTTVGEEAKNQEEQKDTGVAKPQEEQKEVVTNSNTDEHSGDNLPVIDKEDGGFYLYMETNEDTPLIFGYDKPNTESKKVICFSSMTKDVENNPHNCTYGAYYDTEEIKILYVETIDDYVVLNFSSYADGETIFYMKKGDVRFE